MYVARYERVGPPLAHATPSTPFAAPARRRWRRLLTGHRRRQGTALRPSRVLRPSQPGPRKFRFSNEAKRRPPGDPARPSKGGLAVARQ